MEKRVVIVVKNEKPNIRWLFTSLKKAYAVFPDIESFVLNVYNELKLSSDAVYKDSVYTITREPLNPSSDDDNFRI